VPESYPQSPFVPPPDATESALGEAQARAVAERLAGESPAGLFVSTLDRTAQAAAAVGPGAAAVVVGHGGVIAELCRQATGSEPFAFLHVDNASITRIVVGANDITHSAGAAAGPPSRPPP
jgi:broad specificity phosphatase PhoE